jgi:hypothetical protein
MAIYWFLIVSSALGVMAINGKYMVDRKRFVASIKEHASQKNQEILIKNLRKTGVPKKSLYLYLVAPVITVGLGLVVSTESPTAIDHFFFGIIAILLIGHLVVAITSVVHLFKVITTSTSMRGLRLSDFVAHNELFFIYDISGMMLWNGDSHSVLSPDELIPFIHSKKQINELIDAQKKIEAITRTQTELSTEDQIKRNEQVLQEFQKTIKPFGAFLMDFKNAICEKHHLKLEQMKMVDGRVDDIHCEIEMTLMKINQNNKFKPSQEDNGLELSKALQELKRVTQAKQVSENVKSQASDLIDLILEKEVREKSNHEKEMLELDALSVIEASKLFYGIQDDHQGR